MRCRSRAWLGVLLALMGGPAAAHSYRMAVIDVEQLPGNEFRVALQYSGVGQAPRLQRPEACRPAGAERHQPLPRGARVSVTWTCTSDLASLPLFLEPRPPVGTQSYLNWRTPEWALDAVPVGQWPVVAGQLREQPAPAAAPNYLRMGVTHILSGWDHLAFVGGLLALVSGWRRLVAVITTFTLGHSLTLALATLGVLHVSTALAESLIALSIVFLAAETVRPNPVSLLRRYPALLSAFFGLFHGLGFASALREVGVPEGGRLWPLIQFNLGVEMGQLMFVAVAVPAALLWRRCCGHAGRSLLLRLIGVGAGFWTAERVAAVAF